MLNLEKKKEVVAEKLKISVISKDVAKKDTIEYDSDDETEDDFDEYLDWRAKRSLSKLK